MSLMPLVPDPLRMAFPIPLGPGDLRAFRIAICLAPVAEEKLGAVPAEANAVALASKYSTNLRFEPILSKFSVVDRRFVHEPPI
jgi:hypothetical protein